MSSSLNTRPECPPLIRSPEELTPAWLTQALRSTGAIRHAEVSTIALEKMDKGKTGRLVRLQPQYSTPEGSAPVSLIAKFPGSAGPVRDLVLRFGLYEREVHFYRTLAHQAGVPTPKLVYADADASGNTVLLLEDVAAMEGDLLVGASLEQVAVALDGLAAMHARWWNDATLNALGWLPARNNPQTVALSAGLPRRAWADFVKKNSSWLSPLATKLVRRLDGDRSVLDRLSSSPLTLVHGDTRINNMMFESERGLTLRAVVDWQSVMRARPGVDVACLLVNSLSPPERRSAEKELLPAYHRALEMGGVTDYSLADLWTDYRLEILNELNQVVVWSSLGLGGGEGATTIGRLFAAVEDLELLELLPASGGHKKWHPRFTLRRPGSAPH